MSDLISREDAIKAVTIAVLADKDEIEALKAIPSVQVNGDLISRQDAIEAVESAEPKDKEYHYYKHIAVDALSALPSAEAEPTVIRSKTLMPTKDFKEWAKRVRETNPNAVVIPCDAEVVSAEAVQIPIKLEKRYPESKDEDITDAFMRGYLAGRSSADAVQTDCTDFVNWLMEEVMDDENWELNAGALGEIIARKLTKLGVLEVKDDVYVYEPSAEPKTGEWVKVIDEETPNVTKWHYECDQCGQPHGRSKYCPNCGARMTPYKGGDTE